MFCEKAHSLIKEVDRNREIVAPYNNDLVGEVQKEIKHLFEENIADARAHEESSLSGGISYISTGHIRHAAIQRNVRCLLAYHYSRLNCLRKMRWEFGSILPPDIKACLSPSESIWFTKYSSVLAKYMRSVNKPEGGVNLLIDLKPPKALCIEVRCLIDFGKYELSDGTVIYLKKDSRHYLPRTETEELIRQGICEHIIN